MKRVSFRFLYPLLTLILLIIIMSRHSPLTKYAIKMNWRRFNELYETRQKVEYNLNNFIEKKGQEWIFRTNRPLSIAAN